MTVTLVNSTSSSWDVGGSPSSFGPVTIPATTAGNCLVVTVVASTSWPGHSPGGIATVTGVTVNGSADNFSRVASRNHLPEVVAVWVDPNCAGGKTAFTVAGSTLNSLSVCFMEFSGIRATAPYLTSASASGTVSPVASGSYTTTGQSLGVALLTSQGSSITSGVTGWTVIYADNTYYARHCYRIDSTGGTISAAANSSGGNWTAIAVALKPTGLGDVATVDGLAVTSVATILGLTDQASFNGLI